jgi:hypothetical protein
MAQKIQTLLIDDLDGSEAAGTVRVGLDGAEYEIDLNAEHAQALRDALARHVGAARRYAAACPGRAPGTSRRGRQHPGPRMGQGAGHRGEGPRPGTGRASGQIQGRDRTVAAGTPPAPGPWRLTHMPVSGLGRECH